VRDKDKEGDREREREREKGKERGRACGQTSTHQATLSRSHIVPVICLTSSLLYTFSLADGAHTLHPKTTHTVEQEPREQDHNTDTVCCK
jgi:hypothetical protein